MKRPKRDPVREDRIHNEAIVDARPEGQAMSWYYYLEDKISFIQGQTLPRARSAAIGGILKLDEDTIRIGEVKLWSAFRSTTAVRHSHHHVRGERAYRSASAARFDPVTGQRLEHLVWVKTFHG